MFKHFFLLSEIPNKFLEGFSIVMVETVERENIIGVFEEHQCKILLGSNVGGNICITYAKTFCTFFLHDLFLHGFFYTPFVIYTVFVLHGIQNKYLFLLLTWIS